MLEDWKSNFWSNMDRFAHLSSKNQKLFFSNMDRHLLINDQLVRLNLRKKIAECIMRILRWGTEQVPQLIPRFPPIRKMIILSRHLTPTLRPSYSLQMNGMDDLFCKNLQKKSGGVGARQPENIDFLKPIWKNVTLLLFPILIKRCTKPQS